MQTRHGSGVRSLILAPTRELATQIHEEAGQKGGVLEDLQSLERGWGFRKVYITG